MRAAGRGAAPLAHGTPADELVAVGDWLDDIGAPAHGDLRAALAAADGGDGLPEALVHPDPVPRNVVFTGDGPVLIDWAGCGVGPRLPSLTMVLRSGWAAAPFLQSYARRVALTDDEWDRLGALLCSRALIMAAWRRGGVAGVPVTRCVGAHCARWRRSVAGSSATAAELRATCAA